jgi:AcrR family transcriptional regulator
MVSRDGAAVSMVAIAAEAGITKPVLYRHFGDKGGLYAALAERSTGRLLAHLQAALSSGGSSRDRVALTIDTYLSAIEAEPQLYRFLVHSTEAAAAQGQVRSFLRRLSDLLSEGIAAELELPVDAIRARAWAHGVVGMVQASGDWWLEDRPCPREQLTQELTSLLWDGYGAGSPPCR